MRENFTLRLRYDTASQVKCRSNASMGSDPMDAPKSCCDMKLAIVFNLGTYFCCNSMGEQIDWGS